MKLKLTTAALAVWMIAALGWAPPAGAAPAPPAPGLASASAILLDAGSGKVLFARDAGIMRAPASLTKVLTALVVIENSKLSDWVPITPEARAAPGSRIYAEAGWTMSVEDLLYGLLLNSGNDAAIALAQKVSPDHTIAGFMRLANGRAAELGATSTHFVNPHGYDQPGHLASALDLATITLAALHNDTFARIVATKSHQVTWGDGHRHTFVNHNKLLTRYAGTLGVKTGYTKAAGHCLISAARKGGSTLVAVTMAAPTALNAYADSTALFDWGFPNLNALRQQSRSQIRLPAPPPRPAPAAQQPAGQDVVSRAAEAIASLPGARTPGLRLPLSWIGAIIGLILTLITIGAAVGRSQRRLQPQLESAGSEALPYVTRWPN